jgi:hypothetical protein
MASLEKKPKLSRKENAASDPQGHEGEIWHKPFSYTFKGRTVKVAGHWERKPGSSPRPKSGKEGRNDKSAPAAEAEADA